MKKISNFNVADSEENVKLDGARFVLRRVSPALEHKE